MLDNRSIAELFVREAERASGHREAALRKAASEAIMWEEEAAELVGSGRSLRELPGVGPSLTKLIYRWLDAPPEVDPPELRREFLTLAYARRVLAKKPGWAALLHGDLQMHTVWSDGSGTIAEMAVAAIERKYSYIAITDHTKGLTVANGLDEQRLAEQGREIATINKALKKQRVDFTVLRAAEVNLSPRGEGDMTAAALRKLDVVLGCFHSSLRTKDDQTERYLAGLRNRDIQILGHPQTRMYNRRAGLRADWARVFGEAARLDKAVEVDGYADRQDLRLSLLKIAKREGARVSLGTDAHHPDQLAFMELSLAAALLAKIPAERVVNFMPVDELRAWAKRVRMTK